MAESGEKGTENTALLERLFSVGAHFGYSRSRRHPSTSRFIFGAKNRTELFDLEKVTELLHEAKAYMESLGAERKMVLLVGGKNEARSIIARAARDLDMPHVAGRWIGGTLTNFAEIQKRIKRLEDLVEKREKGEFESKYTKRERLMFDREIEDLKAHFEGLLPMKQLPHALLIVDTRYDDIAVKEAHDMHIPIVALLNSDCDANAVDYPIVANDSAAKSISFFIDELVGAYKQGLAQAAAPKAEAK